MATTTMASLGFYEILVREGIHPPITMREADGEIFPGFPVTSHGKTWPEVGKPDGIGESVLGVAGLEPNQPIGTVYTAAKQFPVYLCGSGAIVRMYHDLAGGSIVAGDILVSQTVDNSGHLEPLAKALNDFIADGSAGTILATQIQHIFSLVGRAMETHASTGTTTPIRVLLSI